MKRIFTLLAIFSIGFFPIIAQPVVTNVTSATSDTDVKVTNDVIQITVTFSESLTSVTGTPLLALVFSTGNANATFVSYSGTDMFFTYTVAAEQEASDLAYNGTAALSGATVTSASGTWAGALIASGAVGSLSYNKNLVVDSRTRSVLNVTTNATNGTTYSTPGTDIINCTVNYNYPVYVTGTPRLYLNLENTGAYASYISGSGSENLVFRYTVSTGDQNVTNDYFDYDGETALNPNGGAITFPLGTDVNVTLPINDGGSSITGAGGTAMNFSIDAKQPTVLSVTESSGATSPLKIGSTATVTVTFSEPVVIAGGTPAIILETGSIDDTVDLSSGASDTYNFLYTVLAGHENEDLNYKSTSSLIPEGATIQDAAGNDAILNLPSTSSASSLGAADLFVDGIAPTIVNVTSTARNGSYAPGDSLLIKCTFSELVNSTNLTLGFNFNNLRTVTKAIDDLDEASSYSFYYKIDAGDNEADTLDLLSVSITNSITDTCGNLLSTTVPAGIDTIGSLMKNKKIKIDKTAPQIENIYVAKDSVYGVGQTVIIGVKFDERVLVSGSPKFQLNSHGTDAYATYSSGSSRDSLIFKYRVLEDHSTATELDVFDNTTVIDLSSGSLTDIAGNTAATNYDLPDIGGSALADSTVIINAVKPTIQGISAAITYNDNVNNPGFANVNDTVTISIDFDMGLNVTGTPKLLLETGRRDRYAIFSKLNAADTSIMEFKYGVVAGDTTSKLDVKSSTSLIGGIIKDSLGNPVDRTLTLGDLPAATTIVVDAIAPEITNVTSSTKNGSYNATSDDIIISLTFSEPVNIPVSSGFQLNLNSGTPTVAENTKLDGITTLDVTYQIGATDNSVDLDYTKISADPLIFLDSIRDEHGNALLATAAPDSGSTGSLSRNKTLIIDTKKPLVDSVSCSLAADTFRIGQSVYFSIYFDEKVYVGGRPKIGMNATDGSVNDSAIYYSGSGSNKLRFRYYVAEGFESADLNYTGQEALKTTSADSIYDKAGNKLDLTSVLPAAAWTLWEPTDKLLIDGVKPEIDDITGTITTDNVVGNGAGKGNETDVITVTIVFSEAIAVTGTPRLVLETGRVDRYLTYTGLTAGNTTLNFEYIVQEGDETDSLNVKNTRSLSGSIKDLAGNYAIKTTETTGTTLINNKILVDAIKPTVKRVTSTTGNGYKITGATINVRVEFTEKVDDATGLTLTLDDGTGSTGFAALTNGTVYPLNEKMVDFEFVVATGNENTDLNYASTNPLIGTIKDLNGNTADLTLPSVTSSYSLAGNKNLYVDALAPSFSSVSSPNALGTYGLGSPIYIKLKFDDKVKVSGKPMFSLNSGGTAYYYSGSGTNTLQFKYVVGEGETSSGDLAISSNISFVTTGSIKDLAGNSNDGVISGTLTGIDVDYTSKSAEVEQRIVTDIVERSTDLTEQVRIYPNPVKNSEIAIYFDGNSFNNDVNIKLYDILGNIVVEKNTKAVEKITIENRFNQGIYFLSISVGKNTITNRLIIE